MDFEFDLDYVFQQIDLDGSGGIDLKELHEGLKFLGMPTTLGEAKAILTKYDADANGILDKKEFTVLALEMRKGKMTKRHGGQAAHLAPEELAELLLEVEGDEEWGGEAGQEGQLQDDAHLEA